MPLYEYLTPDGLVERILPVAARDSLPGRLTVPRRVNVHRGLLHPTTLARGVPNALRDLECSMGTSALCREMGFTPQQVQRAWERELKLNH